METIYSYCYKSYSEDAQDCKADIDEDSVAELFAVLGAIRAGELGCFS